MGIKVGRGMCPVLPKDCDSDSCDRGSMAKCRHSLVAPINALHFVGFKDNRYWKADQRYINAVRVFGEPDFWHHRWDARATTDIAPGDVVVFANGDEHTPLNPYGFDDSHADIVAHGGDFDR